MSEPLIYPLPPNRVRRNYTGGRLLAQWDGHGEPADGDCPEDWIASTVAARNPGLPPVADEGLSSVGTPDGPRLLTEVIAAGPDRLLGPAHREKFGDTVGFLTKLLDAGMRLHLQAHPTAAFAQQHLGSRWGKLEAYLILAVRDTTPHPSLYLGFQHCPTPEEWQRIVFEQDKSAMLACFEPIPVKPGEVWCVPGGTPHAIGEGLLVLKIMEPTDLVVRCEFERDGLVVPPEARFMGRDPAFAMRIFEYEEQSAERVRDRYRVTPRVVTDGQGVRHETLFDKRHSECFEVQRLHLGPGTSHRVTTGGRLMVALLLDGGATLAAGDTTVDLRHGARALVAAAADGATVSNPGTTDAELALCLPQV